MDWNSRKFLTLSELAANRHLGKRHKHFAILFVSMGIFVVATQLGLVAQQPPANTGRPARKLPVPAQPAARAEQPKFKAIWEPVNYPDDLTLLDVFFVDDQVGWIGGGSGWDTGGFILQTKDGGDHWAMQLGDPKSSDPSIKQFRFIDEMHGWAVQGAKLVRTSDGGANWEDAGSLPPYVPLKDYLFTSPNHGVFLGGYPGGSSIFTTNDGGKTWKQVFTCATRLEVNGLMQNTGCNLNALQFPSPSVGYAVGGGDAFFVVAKTEDGGESWRVVYTFAPIPQAGRVFFTDASTGFTRNNDGKFYATRDGGLTWRGVTGGSIWETLNFRFADPQVGWSGGARGMSFSTDGGMHWNSRDYHFPVDVQALSFPSRQRAYVVGVHGMIYRYRVVPADYTAARMLEAPMMPGYNLQPIQADLQNVRLRIQALQAKLQAVQAQAGNQAAGPQATLAPSTSIGAAQNTAVAPVDASAQTAAAGGFPQDASAGGGFTQDTLVAGGFTQSTADSGAPAQAPGADAGFVQDTGPPSGFIQSCCAADVQNLQNSMGAFTQNIAAFTTKYRTLNLILAGINLFSELMTKSQGLRTSFHSLRGSRDAQSAIAALNQLSASVNDMGTTAVSRFQGQSSFGGMQTRAPGSFQQQTPFPQ
jgi:photosystem II stability/assembly factor-like uncharacterized protein